MHWKIWGKSTLWCKDAVEVSLTLYTNETCTGSQWWGVCTLVHPGKVCVCVHWCHSQPCWLTIGGTNMTNGSPRWLMKTLCVCLCISQVIISCTPWTGHGKLLQFANEDLDEDPWWPCVSLMRTLHGAFTNLVHSLSPAAALRFLSCTEGERQHQADVFVNLVDSLPS